jgi:FAD:protein FMN transferase
MMTPRLFWSCTPTLNGIAQGYVTDKIVDLLRGQGIDHSLVDMDETRAIGARADGHPLTVPYRRPAPTAIDSTHKAASTTSSIPRRAAVPVATAA